MSSSCFSLYRRGPGQCFGSSVSQCQNEYMGCSGDVSSSARVSMLPEPVMVAAYVSSWQCSGLCLVDMLDLKSLGVSM